MFRQRSRKTVEFNARQKVDKHPDEKKANSGIIELRVFKSLPHELADANGAPAGELLRDILYIGWFAGGPLRFRTNGISRLCTMYSRTGSLLLLLTHSPAKTFLGLWQIYQAHIYVQLVKETDRGVR